jgi:hypothetical protein
MDGVCAVMHEGTNPSGPVTMFMRMNERGFDEDQIL